MRLLVEIVVTEHLKGRKYRSIGRMVLLHEGNCTNHRGIILPYVMGKVYGRILVEHVRRMTDGVMHVSVLRGG